MTGSPVTREISKPSKRTRSGGQDIMNARGAREAQRYGGNYGNYDNYGNSMDTGSGYYGDGSSDRYYDDEDLYDASGDGGSGYDEYGSGNHDVYTTHRKPSVDNTHRQRTSYYEKGSQQPKATKNPTQTMHNYEVHPVQSNDPNGTTRSVSCQPRLLIIAALVTALFSRLFFDDHV